MRYLMLFTVEPSSGVPSAADRSALDAKVGAWWEEHVRAGRILGGERLQPASTATTVRLDGPTPLVLDGPFVESKETIGGYALIDVPDLDVALARARTWPASPVVELRPVAES